MDTTVHSPQPGHVKGRWNMTLTRRQFLGGTAAIVGAAAIPAMASAPAVAAPTLAIPIPHDPWTPLDPKAAARLSWEIYKGKHAPQAA